MTARYHSLTVVLEHDIRDDDAEPLMKAIQRFRGVLSVSGHVADVSSAMAEERARRLLVDAITKVLYPDTHIGEDK